ncbi:hypothetical protein FQA39_LY15971 [Lamprigera yunnana]|nr:hypothetical protein FQA39_LY15971 [Lamprigera yunnana]
MVCKTLLVFVTCVVCVCSCAKILGIVSTPSYSHQVPFLPIWKELSLRGHQVTTITTNPIKDPTLLNLTEIDLSSAYALVEKDMAIVTKQSILWTLFTFNDMLRDLGRNMYSHPEVDALIKNNSETFDLVMSEFIALSTFAMGERFKCPTIALTSMQPFTFLNYVIGNPNHVVIFPDPFFAGRELTLGQSIINFLSYLLMNTAQWHTLRSVEQKLVDEFFGADYPPLIDMLKGISLAFSNSDPIFHKPRHLMPNVIQIGGKVNRVQSKPLQKEVEVRLNTSTNGFIYFSLGSNVKSKDLSEETRCTILETFAELPYTILWKFEADHLPNKSDNVITEKWFSQSIVLNHPNIKLFITQGGLQSTEEAIHARVPMIVLPFFADQSFNAENTKANGFGLVLDYKSLRKEDFKRAILEVINNPMYKNKVRKFADVAEDQPMSGLEKAVWWTEYVIKHKGAKHLRSPILDVPTYRYFLLDIIAVIVLISEMANNLGHNMFSQPQIDALIKNDSETFDVVISEFMMVSSFAFGERFKCPTIAVTSMQPITSLNSLVGNPNHILIFPDPLLPDGELTLALGIIHFLMYLAFTAVQWHTMVTVEQELVYKYFGTDYPPLTDMLKDISLVLTNSDPIFYKPRPLMPNVIQIGGKVSRLPTTPLSKEVEGKLDSSTNGFIYFSLGSNVKSKYLTENVRITIMEAFADLPYTVLWKFEEDNLPNKPDNVIIHKWLPQQIVLNHPNIKLFITQGGLQSIEEAVCARVPMVAMPFFGDQEFNAQKIKAKGFGVIVDHTTLKKEEFKKTILEVINNPIYKDTVSQFANIVEDQPMTGLEKAVWWTEYVIRHKGAKHLRSPILDVPSYRLDSRFRRSQQFILWDYVVNQLNGRDVDVNFQRADRGGHTKQSPTQTTQLK